MVEWQCPVCKITQIPTISSVERDVWEYDNEWLYVMCVRKREERNKYRIEYLTLKCDYCGHVVEVEKRRKLLKRNYRKRRVELRREGYIGVWSPWYKMPIEEDEKGV